MLKLKKLFVGVIMVLAVVGIAGVAMAENQVTINLDGLSPEQVAQIEKVTGKTVDAATKKVVETAEKVAEVAVNKVDEKVAETVAVVNKHTQDVVADVTGVSSQEISAWVQNMTQAVSSFCKTLNIEVNDFITTPVGMILTAFAAMKVAGNEITGVALWLKDLFFGTGIYLFILAVVGWNYKRKRGVYKWRNKETGELTITPKYDWEKKTIEGIKVETWSTVWHAVIFIVATIWYAYIVL